MLSTSDSFARGNPRKYARNLFSKSRKRQMRLRSRLRRGRHLGHELLGKRYAVLLQQLRDAPRLRRAHDEPCMMMLFQPHNDFGRIETRRVWFSGFCETQDAACVIGPRLGTNVRLAAEIGHFQFGPFAPGIRSEEHTSEIRNKCAADA